MRQQYHLRPSQHGLLAWDVFKLIDLTKDLPQKRVPLDSFNELDETYWFQKGQAPPTCRAIAEHAGLIEDADLNHPIILDPDGKIMDGMHRICKALNLGHKDIMARQLAHLPQPDFVGVPENELPY